MKKSGPCPNKPFQAKGSTKNPFRSVSGMEPKNIGIGTQKIDIGAGGPFCTFLDPKNVDFYKNRTLVR